MGGTYHRRRRAAPPRAGGCPSPATSRRPADACGCGRGATAWTSAHRTAAAWGLSARRANGAFLASIDAIEARGLDPIALRPLVRVRKLRAHWSGTGTVSTWYACFPKRNGPPSRIPYSVPVEDARILYVDRAFGKPIEQLALADRAAFDGVGDDCGASRTACAFPGSARSTRGRSPCGTSDHARSARRPPPSGAVRACPRARVAGGAARRPTDPCGSTFQSPAPCGSRPPCGRRGRACATGGTRSTRCRSTGARRRWG